MPTVMKIAFLATLLAIGGCSPRRQPYELGECWASDVLEAGREIHGKAIARYLTDPVHSGRLTIHPLCYDSFRLFPVFTSPKLEKEVYAHLLKETQKHKSGFTYFPVTITARVDAPESDGFGMRVVVSKISFFRQIAYPDWPPEQHPPQFSKGR